MSTPGKRLALLVAAAAIPACYTASIEGRFLDQPIVWRVDDARGIREPVWRYSATVVQKVIEKIDRPDDLPAQNTNALGEVPDSTWFTNRIGMSELTPAQAITGPDVSGPPQPPYRIVEGKIEGLSPGFLFDDARGIRYLLKFDTAENPEQQTAAEVIASRIFWAAGYNVPSNHLLLFTRDELELAPDIVYKVPRTKRRRRLDWEAVDALLANAARHPDGRYRAMVSELLEGKRKGGWLPLGVRKDDPNDVVPHQYRRELRGLRVIAAWLGQTDMTRENTLDMYVRDGGRGYLRHYLVDFGGAFGGQQSELGRKEVGWEHSWDLSRSGKATMSFGLWTREWERQQLTEWKSIGYYSAQRFDPTRWVEFEPYEPFRNMDVTDAYWAAKIVMKFDRTMIEALVAVGELSEPGAAEYLVDTLLARRDKVGETYLEAVTPLDWFELERRKLCAVDLGVRYKFARAGVVELVSRTGELLGEYPVNRAGRVCIPIADDANYRILRLRIRRGRHAKPLMQVHYKGGKRARILGVIRVQ